MKNSVLFIVSWLTVFAVGCGESFEVQDNSSPATVESDHSDHVTTSSSNVDNNTANQPPQSSLDTPSAAPIGSGSQPGAILTPVGSGETNSPNPGSEEPRLPASPGIPAPTYSDPGTPAGTPTGTDSSKELLSIKEKIIAGTLASFKLKLTIQTTNAVGYRGDLILFMRSNGKNWYFDSSKKWVASKDPRDLVPYLSGWSPDGNDLTIDACNDTIKCDVRGFSEGTVGFAFHHNKGIHGSLIYVIPEVQDDVVTTITGTLKQKTIYAVTQIAAVNQGKAGAIFVVAEYKGQFFSLTSMNTFVQTKLGSFKPIVSGNLPPGLDGYILNNSDLSGLVGAKLYIGYGLGSSPENEMYSSGRYKLIYTVQ